MGMFNYVLAEGDKCPKCDAPIDSYQTKDGEDLWMHRLYRNDISNCLTVDNTIAIIYTINNFYTSCDSCNHWLDYVRDINNEWVCTAVPPYGIIRQ
jgi:hypothetical protein